MKLVSFNHYKDSDESLRGSRCMDWDSFAVLISLFLSRGLAVNCSWEAREYDSYVTKGPDDEFYWVLLVMTDNRRNFDAYPKDPCRR